jgi:DNA-directed RNA polymerase sigma subunit (sigma70/sigma32)
MPSQLPKVALDGFGEGELADLDDRTAHVLRMRSGMWDGERHTLREVGEELGIRRERVRQVQNQGLALIRHLREAQRHRRAAPGDS